MGLARGYTYLQNDTDRLWFDTGLRMGWSLPAPAPRWARLWGVRHFRVLIRLFEDTYWDWRWQQLDLYPSGFNDWARYAVLRGWV